MTNQVQRLLACAFTMSAILMGGELIYAADGDEKSQRRVLEEATVSWRALGKFYDELDGLFTMKDTAIGKIRRHTQTSFLINGSNLRLQHRAVSEQSITTMVFNERYCFSLYQENKASAPQVTAIQAVRGTDDQWYYKINYDVMRYVRAPICIDREMLDQLVSKRGFKVTDVSSVSRKSKSLVRLGFEYQPSTKAPYVPPEIPLEKLGLGKSWLLLDPESYWTIQEYSLAYWWGTESGLLEYGEKIEGFPVLRRGHVKAWGSQKPEEVVAIDWSMNKILHRTVPATEFTLSAFNLPEPNLQPRVETANWLRVLAIGIGLLLVAGGLRFYLRKRLRYSQKVCSS